MDSFSAYEVGSEPGLWGAVVLGVKYTVVKGVPFFAQLGGESFPELAPVRDFGVGDILEDEVVRRKVCIL